MGRCALEKFEIAGLTVEFDTGDGLLFERSRPYLTSDDKKTDIKIELDDDFFMRRRQSYPMLTLDECRYVWTGEAFYLKLLEFNGFMLHSSCVCRGGNAYLFSARSGTGKSTHTHLWLSEFPDAYILNDDKPAIVINESGAVAYGTPFSGKNDERKVALHLVACRRNALDEQVAEKIARGDQREMAEHLADLFPAAEEKCNTKRNKKGKR